GDRRDRRSRRRARGGALVHPLVSSRSRPRARSRDRSPLARSPLTGRIGLLVAIVLAAADARGAPRLELVAETAPPLAVTARNVADEPADDVAPAVVYQHRTWTGDAVRLDPGTGHDWRFDLPSPPEPGTAPAIVRVRYRDPRGRTRRVPPGVA